MNNLLQERYDRLKTTDLFLEMKSMMAKKADALTSKMWILPDGQVVSLGQWHYRWILDNAKRVARYGLDVSKLPDTEQVVRIAAIKKGFFRVNYEHTNGALTIEGVKDKFNKRIKDAVFMIEMENVNSIDRVRLILVDANVSKVVRNDELPLFTYRSEEEKIQAVDDFL